MIEDQKFIIPCSLFLQLPNSYIFPLVIMMFQGKRQPIGRRTDNVFYTIYMLWFNNRITFSSSGFMATHASGIDGTAFAIFPI